MPLPQTPPPSPAEAYTRAAQMAQNVLIVAQRQQADIAAGKDCLVVDLVALFDTLRDAKDTGALLAETAGLEDYAQTIMGAGYSINGWFANTLTAGTAVTEWLIANLPGDGAGGIVLRRFVTGGKTEYASVTADQLSPLAQLLADLITALQA